MRNAMFHAHLSGNTARVELFALRAGVPPPWVDLCLEHYANQVASGRKGRRSWGWGGEGESREGKRH